MTPAKSYLYLWTTILQNKLQIWEMQADQKLNLATKIFHVDHIWSFTFFIFSFCGDFKFDLMFFIQLIWWIRSCQIFKKFDLTKMFQILLYNFSNLFDSTNLIKLIPPCISSDLSIVDWFKYLCYFRFLKDSFGKLFH